MVCVGTIGMTFEKYQHEPLLVRYQMSKYQYREPTLPTMPLYQAIRVIEVCLYKAVQSGWFHPALDRRLDCTVRHMLEDKSKSTFTDGLVFGR